MAFTFVSGVTVRANAGTAASTWSLATSTFVLVAGAGLVLGLNIASTSVDASTITDAAGNVWRLAARAPGTKTRGGELWYASNINETSTRISIALSGNSTGNIWLGQWEGMSTGTPLDQTAALNGAASTVHVVTQITPSAADALVVAFYACSGSTIVPVAFDGGFSTNVSSQFCAAGYIIQTSPSTATGQWRTASAGTSTGQVTVSGLIASFFDTNGGAPPAGDLSWHGNFCLVGFQ